MTDHPADRLAALSGEPKRDDETLKEYVERVGAAHGVEEAVLDDGVEYVTEWQYSSDPPDESDRYELFLAALETPAEDDQTVDDESGETTDAPGTTSESAQPDETAELATEPEHATDTVGFRSGLQGKEPRGLLLRFVAILVTAPVLGWAMGRAWVPGHQLYDEGARLLGNVLGLRHIPALELLGMFGLGLYAALLVVFVFDIKKRVQGMLLFFGSAIALAIMAAMGVYIPNIDLTDPLNLLGLGLGLAVGLFVESGQLLAVNWGRSTFRRPTLETGEVPEFRYAAVLVFVLLAAVVVATLAQAFLAEVIAVYDIAAAGVFLVTLGQFIRYESEADYMTLGPERAGKSMLMLGLVLELRSGAATDPDPNDYLQQGLERASNLSRGDEEWPIPSTSLDTVRVASFEVISGYYFPRRLDLSALDYAGQHLGEVAELFDRGEHAAESDTAPGEVASWLADSDTLLFILDVERLVYPEKFQETDVTDEANVSWGLEHYGTILDHTDPDDIVVVATKCDILIDTDRVDPLSEQDSFDAFRQAVTDHLQSRPDVNQLLSTSGESAIHPVYFATARRDEGYLPQLDENGNLVPVGYDHLIDELRARQ